MMKSLSIALVLASASITCKSFASTGCPPLEDIYLKFLGKTRKKVPDFWTKTSPVQIGAQAITFSHDTEVPLDDVLRFIYSDEVSFKKFAAVFPDPMQRSQLQQLLKVSEKQFNAFFLKNGVATNKSAYRISELNPLGAALAMESKSRNVPGDVLEIVQEQLARQGLPLKAHLDSGVVEFTHPSFESNPSQFFRHMQTMDKLFPKGGHHVHLGLPITELNSDQLMSVGKALETKLTLAMAERSVDVENKIPFSDSLLGRYTQGRRGLVRADEAAFGNAHDLEIRVGRNTEDFLNSAEWGTELALKAKSLKKIEVTSHKVDDLYTQNLPSALEYLGLAMKGTQHENIGNELLSFSARILKEKKISVEIRYEIQNFLAANKVSEKITTRLFLN